MTKIPNVYTHGNRSYLCASEDKPSISWFRILTSIQSLCVLSRSSWQVNVNKVEKFLIELLSNALSIVYTIQNGT